MKKSVYTFAIDNTCPYCEKRNLQLGKPEIKKEGGASFPFDAEIVEGQVQKNID